MLFLLVLLLFIPLSSLELFQTGPKTLALHAVTDLNLALFQVDALRKNGNDRSV